MLKFAFPNSLSLQKMRRFSLRFSRTEAVLVTVGLFYMAMTLWWIFSDTQTPDNESARHMSFVLNYAQLIQDGDLFAPFHGLKPVDNLYPPVHEIVGLFGLALFGKDIDSILIMQMLVYLPLMVVGAYGAGRLLYGSKGGVLTLLFLAATPAFIQVFHVYLVDTATLAFATVSVWLLLLSSRFERLGVTFAAGLVVGTGLLTKENFAFILPGLLITMIVRGGWRNPKGLLIFFSTMLAVAMPWYIVHLQEIRSHPGATLGAVLAPGGGVIERYSALHFAVYPSSLLRITLFLPLTVLFAVGFFLSIARWIRTRSSNDYTPELVIGLVVFYLCMLFPTFVDWRFFLPGLIYIVLLGSGWILRLKGPSKYVVIALLISVFAVNTLMINFGVGKPVGFGTGYQRMTVFSNQGIVSAKPMSISKLPEIFRKALKEGIHKYWIAYSPDKPFLNLSGLKVMASLSSVSYTADGNLQGEGMGIVVRAFNPEDPKPCTSLTEDGKTVVYLIRGPVYQWQIQAAAQGGSLDGLRLYCPV